MEVPFITAERLRDGLTFGPLIEHLRRAHRMSPPAVDRLLMSDGKGGDGARDHFLILAAWTPGDAMGVKVTTVFPGNPARPAGHPAVQALYVLLDGADGSPVALVDGTEMTYWKTAADSALGADYLARRDASKLLMVGAGGLAPHLIRAYLSVRPAIGQVLVWNRTAVKAAALADGWSGPGEVSAVTDLEPAVRAADVVCCVTAASEPVVLGDWLRPGTHLDLIGGFTPEMRETDDEAVRRSHLFVDSRWFTIGQCGDLTGPFDRGVRSATDVEADLFDLASGRHPGRRTDDELTLFKSGGGGHLDLMAARHIVDALGPIAG
ncbi:MAG: ornithine cyclodeaminase [Ilumatobacteraceae bacterium]